MATVFNVATVLCPAKLRRKFCAILSCAGFLPESLKFYGFMYPKIGGPKSTYPKWSKMISTLSASELIHSIDTETTKPPTTVFWGYVLGIYIYTYIIIYIYRNSFSPNIRTTPRTSDCGCCPIRTSPPWRPGWGAAGRAPPRTVPSAPPRTWRWLDTWAMGPRP